MEQHNYTEVFSKLTYETGIIVFLKKSGEIRTMIATRNLDTINQAFGFQGDVLGGHDKRCNISNGNVAVYDLILGDARSFNITRLISIYYIGVISTKEQYDKAIEDFVKFKSDYESTHKLEISMDTFDGNESSNASAVSAQDINIALGGVTPQAPTL